MEDGPRGMVKVSVTTVKAGSVPFTPAVGEAVADEMAFHLIEEEDGSTAEELEEPEALEVLAYVYGR